MYSTNEKKFMPWCENPQNSQGANPHDTLNMFCKLSCGTQHSGSVLHCVQCNVQHHRIECRLNNGAQEISGCGLAMAPVHFWFGFWQSTLCRPPWWTANVLVAKWLQPLTHGTRAKHCAWQSATSRILSPVPLWRAGGEWDHAAVLVFSHHVIVLRVLDKWPCSLSILCKSLI